MKTLTKAGAVVNYVNFVNFTAAFWEYFFNRAKNSDCEIKTPFLDSEVHKVHKFTEIPAGCWREKISQKGGCGGNARRVLFVFCEYYELLLTILSTRLHFSMVERRREASLTGFGYVAVSEACELC